MVWSEFLRTPREDSEGLPPRLPQGLPWDIPWESLMIILPGTPSRTSPGLLRNSDRTKDTFCLYNLLLLTRQLSKYKLYSKKYYLVRYYWAFDSSYSKNLWSGAPNVLHQVLIIYYQVLIMYYQVLSGMSHVLSGTNHILSILSWKIIYLHSMFCDWTTQ